MLRGAERVVAVVDDDPAVLDSLQDLLESRGYSVRSFLSAEEFLEGDAPLLIGCLISDIELPGMDGWSLETLVLDRRPQMPIIFVTARGEIDELRKKLCFNDVPRIIFKKPFDGGQLLKAVDTAFLGTNGPG
jgi:FixJ family two-component response regulator